MLYHYREGGDRDGVESHLATCDACRVGYRKLQRTLATFESLAVPEPDEGFEARTWQRVQPGLAVEAGRGWRALFSPARLALAGAMAVLVIAAFVVGRSWPRLEPAAPATSGAGEVEAERVLLLAVTDHLDRSQRALTELVNAEPGKTVDISTEQRWVRDLVPANRLYRQTAAEAGEAGMASLLDDLERVLLEVAHSPSNDVVAGVQRDSAADRVAGHHFQGPGAGFRHAGAAERGRPRAGPAAVMRYGQ